MVDLRGKCDLLAVAVAIVVVVVVVVVLSAAVVVVVVWMDVLIGYAAAGVVPADEDIFGTVDPLLLLLTAE